MIYCPECGTANRDGSKFCNECGRTLLAQTGVKCPQCDTLNAVQSVFCSHCGGRLLTQPSPASAITPQIKGLSLPTKPTVGEGAEEVEQPLTESLGVPVIPDIEPLTRSPRLGGVGELIEEEGEEIPDWLRDLQASLPIEPEVDASEPELSLRPLQSTQAEAEQASEPERLLEPEQAAEAPPTIPEAPQAEAATGTIGPASDARHEVPDWLAELGSLGSVAQPSQPPAPLIPLAEEEELPSWLAELKPAEAEAPAGPSVEAEPEGEELPSWLTELKPAEAEAPAGPSVEAEPEGEELPSWLTGLKPAEAEAPAGPSVEAEPEEEELPSWLTELKPAEAGAPTGPSAGAKSEEPATTGSAIGVRQEEAPPGRQTYATPEVVGPEPAPPAAGKVSEAQTKPSWLSDLAVTQTPLEVTPAGGELPDWLVPTPELGIPGEEETLARAEIPEWLLALKPRELKEEGEVVEPAVEEAVEQTGVLAGIRDVLPVEMLIAQPRAATPADTMGTPFTGEVALIQASRVRLFDEIVTQPPVAVPKALAKPRVRVIDRLPWWIIYSLLILAVGVPLLLGKPLFDRSIEAAPSVQTLYETIESLPGNAQVLVAVDYDPTTSGEMDIVAQSIVGHLMDRQARIVAVSLLPAGPATAENLVKEVAASYPGYQVDDGQRYVNLGYLPGQAAAIRLMGQALPDALPRDFEGRQVTDLAALSGITSTQSFDLIVELAAGSDTLRWWIEQAGAPYGVPIVAGVSAAVDPMARTYSETEPQQLKGVTGGVLGAASYESLRSGGAGPEPEMAARLDSLLAGQVLVILVILGGTIVGRNWIRPKHVAQHGTGREQ